jgi:site-specific recombinase XerD
MSQGSNVQWKFTMSALFRKTMEQGRHHIDESLVQKAVRDAVTKAGLTKRATGHTFRHSLARTYSKLALTFERSRSCWGIAMSR